MNENRVKDSFPPLSEQDPDREMGDFLSRWSRRKAGLESEASETHDTAPAVPVETTAEETGVRRDPRTGKPLDELTDEDMPDIETLDQDSDLSAFMGRNISPTLRMKALSKVFQSAKYNKVCLCAEYAEDYTNFTPLGEMVPHDLKQAIVREAGKLRESLSERGLEISPEEAESRVAAEYRGERLPDVEELARETTEREIRQAARERPERLQS
ncbi:MAG: DUF3306 domain-containing protein [Ectothiorhodospiraceae bacterium]|nr:DUF3306 domain-containing protein [Ectothiorhodospiraceae bacterium]